MQRVIPLLVTMSATMVVALMMVAMATVPVFAGGAGDEEDKDNQSASAGASRNGQIVFRRYFDPDQTKSAIFTMNPDGSHLSQITTPPRAGVTRPRRGLLMGRGWPSIVREPTST